MAAGHPLTDEDRWPWLDTIAAWIDERVAAADEIEEDDEDAAKKKTTAARKKSE